MHSTTTPNELAARSLDDRDRREARAVLDALLSSEPFSRRVVEDESVFFDAGHVVVGPYF